MTRPPPAIVVVVIVGGVQRNWHMDAATPDDALAQVLGFQDTKVALFLRGQTCPRLPERPPRGQRAVTRRRRPPGGRFRPLAASSRRAGSPAPR